MRTVVGEKTAKVLEKAFGIQTIGDLLRHYPFRYFERGELTNLAELRPGEHATLQVRVVKVFGKQIRPNLHKTDVTITDGTRHQIVATFFNRKFLPKVLQPDMEIVVSGEVEVFNRKLQLKQPDIALNAKGLVDDAGKLMPIYRATKDVRTWALKNAVDLALGMVDLPESLPDDLRTRRGLMGRSEAIHAIHQPESREHAEQAKDRLRFDEAFVTQVVLAQRRNLALLEPAKPRARIQGGLLEAFDASLPFTLTAGQREVGEQLFEDLARGVPMHRLLQGEVGSGKTVVAVRAMLAVVDAGGQAALLAPTEVLAQQHARSIDVLLGPLGRAGQLDAADRSTAVALITGSMGAAARQAALLDVITGRAGIVIGTHALLEKAVQFEDLGLVVVDEQHRFGVEQRDALRAKADSPPHLLVMTATPIPRTVAMTVYGDLETSTLAELPAGRQPIKTTVVPTADDDKAGWLDRAWQRAREEVASGRQVFVVCPRIDADDAAEEPELAEGWSTAAAVEDVTPMLAQGPLAGLRIEMLHGRMPSERKDDVMQRFAAGKIDVLVATTVIEVGVDVPNATTMIVLDADRFGISQLHQLRGRVGRGGNEGVCLLVTNATRDTPARERLAGIEKTLDGFELARLDLKQRREGDVLGESQSGRRRHLKLLELLRDEAVIVAARSDAIALVAEDPTLERHEPLRAAVSALVADERAEFLGKA